MKEIVDRLAERRLVQIVERSRSYFANMSHVPTIRAPFALHKLPRCTPSPTRSELERGKP